MPELVWMSVLLDFIFQNLGEAIALVILLNDLPWDVDVNRSDLIIPDVLAELLNECWRIWVIRSEQDEC